MKITAITAKKASMKLVRPFTVAWGTMDSQESWVVRVETDEGITGHGSVAPTPFVTGDTINSSREALEMIASALIGTDPCDIAGAHALMDSVILHNGPAKCGVDIALYDILGKKQGLPVYRLLGGSSPSVETDCTVGINSPEKMLAEAMSYVNGGIRILKVKIGLDFDHDIEALKLIRAAAGDGVRIRVDANQGYDVETALRAMKAFEAIGIDAAEQFLPWWDFEGAAELMRRNDTSVKLMLDESIHDVHDAARAADMRCADYFNIKLMKCGGLYYGAQIADIAGKAGIKCMVGCMGEDRISLTAAISLVAAKESIVEADCDSLRDVVKEPEFMRGGFSQTGGICTLSSEPGLGVSVDF